SAEITIDSKGKVATPGLINCHTHLPMTLFRGIAEDQPLTTWLTQTIWPLEAKLTPNDIYQGALLGCLENIKNGTTTFADMYFHEEKIAKAVEKAGLRAVLAQGIIEAENRQKGEHMLKESVEFAQKYDGYADGRVTTQLGPHAVYTCSPQLLSQTREEASKLGIGIHIHLAESKQMAKLVKKRHGLTEIELLESIDFLKSNVLAAHCIYLMEKEMRIMAKHNVKVSYNPTANMKIASGTPKIKTLVNLGITVGIGTDGPASNNNLDMFKEMKTAALLQKIRYMDPTVLKAQQVLEMATIDGAKALGLEKTVGSLEVGKKADIILIDFRKPHLTPIHDPYANIVYSARGSDVDTVIVNGKLLMEGRKVKTLDEQEVMQKAQRTASNLLTR
ncbi:MAG: amidohydrolase family protein, partial [Candidatus Bathyarchaeota archaeon]|nr:amidohydrolase family protein [Candidatus Bathyarchaeota archaeon]